MKRHLQQNTSPLHLDLTQPLAPEHLCQLRAGQMILLSGPAFAARDAAHKRMVETLAQGQPLPVDVRGRLIYYIGPTPAKPGQVIGSAGPTTAGRMDRYMPQLLAQGLALCMGKGSRSMEVRQALQKHQAVYLAALGGAGALLRKCIRKYEVLHYPELGPEALALLELDNFPAIVVNDVLGNDAYEQALQKYTSRL